MSALAVPAGSIPDTLPAGLPRIEAAAATAEGFLTLTSDMTYCETPIQFKG